MKKFTLTIIWLALTLLVSCNEITPEDIKAVTLNPDEIELLEIIGEDIQIVSDSTYADIITEIPHHITEYKGRILQIEGIYSENLNNELGPYVYRTLVHDNLESIGGLPLVYMQKDIPDNSWIRVFGIINIGEINNSNTAVLEVLAIEVLPQTGEARLEWHGSAHNH